MAKYRLKRVGPDEYSLRAELFVGDSLAFSGSRERITRAELLAAATSLAEEVGVVRKRYQALQGARGERGVTV